MTTTRPASAPAAPLDATVDAYALLGTHVYRRDGADAERLAREYLGKRIDAE